MMEAVRTTETSVSFNETRQRYTQEGCHIKKKTLYLYKFTQQTNWKIRFTIVTNLT
jgi:hypothetical protein